MDSLWILMVLIVFVTALVSMMLYASYMNGKERKRVEEYLRKSGFISEHDNERK